MQGIFPMFKFRSIKLETHLHRGEAGDGDTHTHTHTPRESPSVRYRRDPP